MKFEISGFSNKKLFTPHFHTCLIFEFKKEFSEMETQYILCLFNVIFNLTIVSSMAWCQIAKILVIFRLARQSGVILPFKAMQGC
jgi:hypothetical protein